MSPDKMMEEVWRWKEEVARETAACPLGIRRLLQELEQQAAERTGVKLDLPRVPGPLVQRRKPA